MSRELDKTLADDIGTLKCRLHLSYGALETTILPRVSKLTSSEQRLWDDVTAGRKCIFGEDDPRRLKSPRRSEPQRTIRGSVLAELIAAIESTKPIVLRQLHIQGVRVTGKVDLSHSNISIAMRYSHCIFDDALILNFASLKTLEIERCSLLSIIAVSAQIAGYFEVKGCDILGSANIKSNEIGSMGSTEAAIRRQSRVSVFADSLKVSGGVLLHGGSHSFGEIRLASAKISDYLVFSGSKLENPDGEALVFERADVRGHVMLDQGFHATGEVRMCDAQIGGQLKCDSSTFENPNGFALNADGIQIAGSMCLQSGFQSKGEVRLPGAQILGSLQCSDGIFDNANGIALNASGIDVKGGVFLDSRFRAIGQVRFVGAQINNGFICTGADFNGCKQSALVADGSAVRGAVHFDHGFQANGQVRLIGMHIVGQLSCAGGKFDSTEHPAIHADDIDVTGSIFLNEGFKSKKAVSLSNSKIAGRLECSSASFNNPGGRALVLDGSEIAGDVTFSKDFTADGEVSLYAARLGTKLECTGGQFHNPHSCALNAINLRVPGVIALDDGFSSKGSVILFGARFESLTCSGGVFDSGHRTALGLDRAIVKGNLQLSGGMSVTGSVRIVSARVSSQVVIGDATLSNPDDYALSLQQTHAESLWIGHPKMSIVGAVDLRSAHVSILVDNPGSLPRDLTRLDLDGLVYESISPVSPRDVPTRLKWLNRQPEGYRPQPFDQLAAVYRRSGEEHEARETLIAKRRARRAALPGFCERFVDRIWDCTVLYGWKPSRPLVVPGAVAVLVGLGLVEAAHRVGITEHIRGDLPSMLHSAFLALDVALPVVDLGIRSGWYIDAAGGGTFAALLTLYLWILELVGWSVVTLALAALTGIVKRD